MHAWNLNSLAKVDMTRQCNKRYILVSSVQLLHAVSDQSLGISQEIRRNFPYFRGRFPQKLHKEIRGLVRK